MAEAADLALTQVLSPAFPVGGFAYSHGLEAAIAAGEVTTAAALAEWIADVLRFGAGRIDAALLAGAMAADADLDALADEAVARAASRERLEETLAQGAAFVRLTNAMHDAALPDLPYPVAVGAVSARLGAGVATAAGLYLQCFASNLVAVAVRFMPLGQTEGQKVLAGLLPVIAEIAAEAGQVAPDEIGGATFGADLAAMRHETMDVRIFKT